MMAYCGQTREMGLVQRLLDAGIGECTVRGELKSRKRDPWFYDNGAFRDWRAGKPFDYVQFSRDMRRIHYSKGALPDFVVVPDVVADGVASLAFSRAHRDELGVEGDERQPCAYLAVQDGMTGDGVRAFLDDSYFEDRHRYHGIFVGGSLAWKLETGAAWVQLAHGRGVRCHVGRVGTPERVRWAQSIGADSIDSCLPLMYEAHLVAFLGALKEAA